VIGLCQTDVTYGGDDLVDYVVRELEAPPLQPRPVVGPRRVPFWSDLVEGVDRRPDHPSGIVGS
jgi:hypothetical protein